MASKDSRDSKDPSIVRLTCERVKEMLIDYCDYSEKNDINSRSKILSLQMAKENAMIIGDRVEQFEQELHDIMELHREGIRYSKSVTKLPKLHITHTSGVVHYVADGAYTVSNYVNIFVYGVWGVYNSGRVYRSRNVNCTFSTRS